MGCLQLLQSTAVAPADVAVVVIGVNDLTDEVPLRHALRWRRAITAFLLAGAGAKHVLFTSMPEMERFPLIRSHWRGTRECMHGVTTRRQARWARSLPTSAISIERTHPRRVDGARWLSPGAALYAEVAVRIGEAVVQRTRAQMTGCRRTSTRRKAWT